MLSPTCSQKNYIYIYIYIWTAWRAKNTLHHTGAVMLGIGEQGYKYNKDKSVACLSCDDVII